MLSTIPAAMQLRYLQMLTEIGAEQNSMIIFAMPIDIIKPFGGRLPADDGGTGMMRRDWLAFIPAQTLRVAIDIWGSKAATSF